jgi:HEAT repeat protein
MSVGVAWGGAGLPKREDMPKYMSLLKSPNPKDRAMAAEMLGRRGQVNFKDVENAVEPLKQTLQNDKDAGARKAAALALGNIHPEAATAVPLLIEKTKSDAVLDVRVAAAESLGVFGTEAKEGASAIRELMQKFDAKKDRNTRKVLQAALMNVTGAQKKK